MADKQRQTLESVVSRHFKDKLADSWNKYQALCKRLGVPIKQIISDPSLYTVKNIKIEHVQKLLTKELNDMKIIAANKEKEEPTDPEERAAKRRKLEEESSKNRGVTCDKCHGYRILYIYAHSNDSNNLIFPNGYSYEGYFPRLPGICCGDSLDMNVCVDCGHIVGFDTEAVTAKLESVEANPDTADD